MKIRRPVTRKLQAEFLKALPGLLPSLTITRTAVGKSADVPCDLLIDVLTPSGRKRKLHVEIKAANAPSRIPQALRQITGRLQRASRGYPVLASTFLSPRARELCREEGVGYLDLAGNCFLQFDDFYLQKIVDKNPFPSRGRPASLFTPISSRILRTLLEEPTRAWHVIELAAVAQVSLGQASKVCRRLVEEAYAANANRQFRVTQPAKLLEAWREKYSVNQSTHAPYYSFERDPEHLLNRVAMVAKTNGWRYAVTSFSAAMLVAPFVRGILAVQWYVSDEVAVEQWVEALDLRPSESGSNAVLLSPYDQGVFYRTQTVNDVILVGNIQLYLDLYSDPARGREQAEFLRKERLGF